MVLYLCVLIVFSLCRESLKLILTTDPFLRWFCHVMHLLVFALTLGGVQPFAYPLAKLSTTWANTDASLMHHVTYRDGSVARAALLRLNPGDYGRCFTFGFFCTNHRSSPCVDFLLGVAVVYSNRGGDDVDHSGDPAGGVVHQPRPPSQGGHHGAAHGVG
jgi:hypothetical protein